MSFTYEYPRPMVTTDLVIFRQNQDAIEILLIKRNNPPFQNHWALPGGFVDKDEALIDAALRELKEETQLENIPIEQLHTFGDPGRDPRGHCITVVFWGWLKDKNMQAKAGDDAKEAAWFSIQDLPKLAFDHDRIIAIAISKVK